MKRLAICFFLLPIHTHSGWRIWAKADGVIVEDYRDCGSVDGYRKHWNAWAISRLEDGQRDKVAHKIGTANSRRAAEKLVEQSRECAAAETGSAAGGQ